MLQDASKQRGLLTRQLARLAIIAHRKGRPSAPSLPLIVNSAELQSQATMQEITPPLLSSQERGQGDSINARLHRLLRG
jgi:hypothetical protein